MSEHTPGPWKIDSKFCVGPVSQEDDQSYGMVIAVADVYGPNRQADAELIASAPTLRDENARLRRALEHIARMEWQPDAECEYEHDARYVFPKRERSIRALAEAALDGGKGVQGGK